MSRPDKRKEIGLSLQTHRKKAGFKSAKAFAESIGFNPNTYTQYEQGLTRFNYEQAWIMADALNCTLDDLGGRKSHIGNYDSDTSEVARRYSELPPSCRTSVKDMIEVQEAKLEKSETVQGDTGWEKSA